MNKSKKNKELLIPHEVLERRKEKFFKQLKYKYFNKKTLHYLPIVDEFFDKQSTIEIPAPNSDIFETSIPYDDVFEFCLKNNIRVQDYKKGLCIYKNSKNVSKLTKYIPPKLQKEFINDPERMTFTNTKMIISRRPIDIIKISTDRNWSSCMNCLNKFPVLKPTKPNVKSYNITEPLKSILKEGKGRVFPVYFVNNDDNLIERPHGRTLIYVCESKNKDYLMYPINVYYGNFPNYLRDILYDYCAEFNEKHAKRGEFYFIPKCYCEKISIDNEIYYPFDVLDGLKKIKCRWDSKTTKNKIVTLKALFLDNYYDSRRILYFGKVLDKDKIIIKNSLYFEDYQNNIHHLKSLKDIFILDENFTGLHLNSIGSLRNLEGLPEKMEYLNVQIDNIFSLKGCPKEINNGIFKIFRGGIIYDIKYFPKRINNNLFYNFGFLKIIKSLKKMKHFGEEIQTS